MGQKVNPVGLRLGINRGWDSVWYASKKNFGNYGKNKCFCLITTNKIGNVSLNVKCELIDYKGNKNWSVLKRNSFAFSPRTPGDFSPWLNLHQHKKPFRPR